MIRVINFYKAILAGAAAAFAWELLARLLILSGFPVVDLVRVVGTLIVPGQSAWAWWPAGLLIHLSVGAIGAIFYAYFFYARLPWPPLLQGAAFGLLAAVPIYQAVYPLLLLMHEPAQVAHMNLMDFGHMLGGSQRVGLIVGHIVYGTILGAFYTRPVGRSTSKPPQSFKDSGTRPMQVVPSASPSDGQFMFATGVECSYPTIDNGRWRLDQMESTGHYRHWREDFALTAETGITHLRYGPPLHRVFLGPDRYDWSFTDAAMAEMQRLALPSPLPLAPTESNHDDPLVLSLICTNLRHIAKRRNRFYLFHNSVLVQNVAGTYARLYTFGVADRQRTTEQ